MGHHCQTVVGPSELQLLCWVPEGFEGPVIALGMSPCCCVCQTLGPGPAVAAGLLVWWREALSFQPMLGH